MAQGGPAGGDAGDPARSVAPAGAGGDLPFGGADGRTAGTDAGRTRRSAPTGAGNRRQHRTPFFRQWHLYGPGSARRLKRPEARALVRGGRNGDRPVRQPAAAAALSSLGTLAAARVGGAPGAVGITSERGRLP